MSDFKLTDAEKADVVDEVAHYLGEDTYDFGVYLRKFCVTGATSATSAENLYLVEKELRNAKAKHPGFIYGFSAIGAAHADSKLEVWRNALENCENSRTTAFLDVLMCELAEVESAYAHGDLEHARQELAQCAAVCVRGMEYIQAEIARKEKNHDSGRDL